MWAYRFRFMRTLKKKAVLKDRQFPRIVNLDEVLKSATFEEFDTRATAPLHGFRDAHDYWRQCSCGQFLQNVRRPLLMLSAEDDPFIQGTTFPSECASQSQYLYPFLTKAGGHTGFVHGSPLRPRFWAEEQTLRFFQLLQRLM
jgi:predicted alpha/beta-fold hydrolase